MLRLERTGLVIADTMRETFGYTWAFPHSLLRQS